MASVRTIFDHRCVQTPIWMQKREEWGGKKVVHLLYLRWREMNIWRKNVSYLQRGPLANLKLGFQL